MNKRNKGFTLIELLAVIVILAVIALIATPLIMNVISDAKKGAMEQNKRTMERAGELFIWDEKNKDRGPKLNGDRTYIQLEELENGYMKKIQGDCEGYVAVDNESGEYYYTAYLDCGDGNTLSVDSEYVNYGGKYVDEFIDAIKTKDGGFLTVGTSNSPNFGKQSNHNNNVTQDGMIVKYTKDGKVEWENHFGGSRNDNFSAVIEIEDGYLVTGTSYSKDGDMSSLDAGAVNLFLLKYNKRGKLIDKVLISKSRKGGAIDLIENNGKIYVVGSTRETKNGSNLAMVACLNEKLELEWKKFYGGTYYSAFRSISISKNGNLLVGGNSASVDGDMSDIKIGELGVANAILFELDPNNGTIVSKYAYDQFGVIAYDMLVYDDFYIVSDGYTIVKINSHTGEILNSISIGSVTSLQKISDEILYTKSGNNITYGKLNENLEKVQEKTYPTTEYTKLNRVVEEKGEYYSFGMTYSMSDIFENFNFGNSDAILLKIDHNLQLKVDFKLQTLLKQKLPELVKDYGTKMPTPKDRGSLKIYTTNDPTREIGTWCDNSDVLDPNSNYRYPNCLKSFNASKIKSIGYKTFYEGNTTNHHITVSVSPNNINHWLNIQISYGNSGAGQKLSNLKIKFKDKEETTIKEAVDLGYIEPLVVSGYLRDSDKWFFENSYQLLLGGSTGDGTYPQLNIYLKPKNKSLESVSFDTKLIPSNYDRRASIAVYELRDFDMSLTPAKEK